MIQQNDNIPLVFNQEDQWSRDQYVFKTRLLVKLNNGDTIYDDDGRPEHEEKVFWRRLQKYMSQHKNLRIDEILIQFRSNIISPIPKKSKGYYFAKFGGQDLGTGQTDEGFVLGWVENDKLLTKTILIPYMNTLKEDEREIENNIERMIWNQR